MSVEAERDFYRELLELTTCDAAEPFLAKALALLVEQTRARAVYIELSGDEGRCFSTAKGCDEEELAQIRTSLSRGIIAEALATGETVLTASAQFDERFAELGSVREHAIEAVLCAPIGRDLPVGVVYLKGDRSGQGQPFPADVVAKVELFARAVASSAELLLREGTEREPQTLTATPFGAVVARSAPMSALVQRLALVASLDIDVLLTGPTGAGKSLLASALHSASPRCAQPLVQVNCAAIPEALLENELFGAEPGAHSTVPRSGVMGKVRAAEGGTLFLDEVGELSLTSQAKLLQLLQDRSYFPLGSAHALQANVRIVAATNAELEHAVAEKRFREDLYYRLRVFHAAVPPLAERAADLVPLATHFVRVAAARHSLPLKRLSSAATRAIHTAPWPGNVRELANGMESAVLNAHLRGSETVDARDIFPERGSDEDAPPTLQEATRRHQAQVVRATLEAKDWNVSEAARELDIARSYLYTLIRAHGLRRAS